MIRNIFQRNQHPTEEDLSAYVDRSPAELRRFARHIESCEACRERVTELREVKATLARLPRAQTTRSFALGAEYARVDQRAASRGPGRLVLAPIASFVILVALVGVDLTAVGTGSSSNDAATASVAEETKAYSTQDSAAGGAERNAAPNVPLTAPAAGVQPEAATGTSGGAQVPPSVAAPRTGPGPEVTPPATGAQVPPVVTPPATGLQVPPAATPPSAAGAPSVAGPTTSGPSVPVATPGATIDTFAADEDDSVAVNDDSGASVLRALQVLALGVFLGSTFLVLRRRSSKR